jgi:hypothetical protein
LLFFIFEFGIHWNRETARSLFAGNQLTLRAYVTHIHNNIASTGQYDVAWYLLLLLLCFCCSVFFFFNVFFFFLILCVLFRVFSGFSIQIVQPRGFAVHMVDILQSQMLRTN